MTADITATCEIAGGHRPPLQFDHVAFYAKLLKPDKSQHTPPWSRQNSRGQPLRPFTRVKQNRTRAAPSVLGSECMERTDVACCGAWRCLDLIGKILSCVSMTKSTSSPVAVHQ